EQHRNPTEHRPHSSWDRPTGPWNGRHTPLPVPHRGLSGKRRDAADLPAPVRRQLSRLRDPGCRPGIAQLPTGASSLLHTPVADRDSRRLHRLLLLCGGTRRRGQHRQSHRGSAHRAGDGERGYGRTWGRDCRTVRRWCARRGRTARDRHRRRDGDVLDPDTVYGL
ncbi:MAG: hypothetical protein AVDCRST_MAG58-3241, partial [uncultured Rubrobacteraceae bacterium]